MSCDAMNQTPTWRCCCCQGCQNISRRDLKAEIIQLVKISWPVMLYQVLVFMLTVISILFSGHLGPTELAAAALGQSLINVACKSVLYGFTTACDTLFAQTYGSNNKKRVGVILQRGILTSALVLIICISVLVNTHPILLLFGQDPEVSRLAGVYAFIYLIGAPADLLAYLLIKYLQCQNHMMPTVVTMTVTVALSVGIHFLLIQFLGFGLNGAIGAQVCSYYILLILLVVYIKWKKLHVETWAGWTLDCLQEWGLMLKLGIPGAFMLCLEWWSFEVGFFVAGSLGTAEVGAHSVLFYVATTLWSVGGGLGMGGTIHIGNLLGANQPKRAKMSSWILLGIGCGLGASFSLLILALKDVIGYIFTTDSDILQVLSEVIILLAFFELLDQMNGVASGVVRGAGHQLFGAPVNFICITCIGLPLGMVLIFVCDLGLIGLWTGQLVGFIFQNACFITFILRMDWNTEALKAMKRAAALPEEEQNTKEGDTTKEQEHLEKLYPTLVTENISDQNCEEETLSDKTKDAEKIENNVAKSNSAVNRTYTSVSKSPGEVTVLTADSLPLAKLIIRPVLALTCCLLWLCGAIAFSVFNPISHRQGDVIVNATSQGNYSQSLDLLM